MRILLATDGSRPADRARDLVASIPWPKGSIIRVVGVVEHRTELFGGSWSTIGSGRASEIEDDVVRTVRLALDAAERELSRPGIRVESYLPRGRAADEIVAAAREFEADLVVVGNRGHGTLETMLLGSVSAEVVDHAPCPVLVGRTADLGNTIVFGEDGTESAAHAAEMLAASTYLSAWPITVLSVADVAVSWPASTIPGADAEIAEAQQETVVQARARASELAIRRAEAFGQAGFCTAYDVAEGEAPHALIELARHRGAGLIVLGSRGHTGIVRWVLGSVARNVLVHAPCSVLIVREKALVRHEEVARLLEGIGDEERTPVALGRD